MAGSPRPVDVVQQGSHLDAPATVGLHEGRLDGIADVDRHDPGPILDLGHQGVMVGHGNEIE